jgi:hypothetical protein
MIRLLLKRYVLNNSDDENIFSKSNRQSLNINSLWKTHVYKFAGQYTVGFDEFCTKWG